MLKTKFEGNEIQTRPFKAWQKKLTSNTKEGSPKTFFWSAMTIFWSKCKIFENLFSSFERAEAVPGAIQSTSVNVSDDELSSMFDLEATRRQLMEEESKLTSMGNEDHETSFMEATSKFRI